MTMIKTKSSRTYCMLRKQSNFALLLTERYTMKNYQRQICGSWGKDGLDLEETIVKKCENFVWTQCKKFCLKILYRYGEIVKKYFTHLWRQWPCLLQGKTSYEC